MLAFFVHFLQNPLYRFHVPLGRVVVAVTPPKGIGPNEQVRLFGRTRAALAVEFITRYVHRATRITVVARLAGQYVRPTRSGVGHAQGQLVGLAAGIDEVQHTQFFGQVFQQFAGEFFQCGVEVARVRIEQPHLLPPRPHHRRVFVAYVGDVVHRIEPGLAPLVDQVNPRPAQYLQRAVVTHAQTPSQVFFAKCYQRLVIAGCLRLQVGVFEQQIRIGTDTGPGF